MHFKAPIQQRKKKKLLPFVAFSGLNLFTQCSSFMVKEEEPFGVLVFPPPQLSLNIKLLFMFFFIVNLLDSFLLVYCCVVHCLI